MAAEVSARPAATLAARASERHREALRDWSYREATSVCSGGVQGMPDWPMRKVTCACDGLGASASTAATITGSLINPFSPACGWILQARMLMKGSRAMRSDGSDVSNG